MSVDGATQKRLIWKLTALTAAGAMLVAAGCRSGERSDADERREAELREQEDAEVAEDAGRMAEQLEQAMRDAELGDALPEDFQLNRHPDWPRQAGDPEPVEAERVAEPSFPTAMLFRQWMQPRTVEPGEPEARPDLLSDAELYEELLARLRGQARSPLAHAVRVTPLGLLRENPSLDPALVEPLSERQAEQLYRYHELIRITQQQMIDRDARPDRRAIEQQFRELFADQPLSIEKMVLARQVNGYGIYEPFEQYKFLSGQNNRMIIYIELENFTTRESAGEHEVELSQEVSLYNESDGLRVWREDPVQIVDRSRNQRRDFFVVQMITLPERLSVGRYYLNVRVTDVHGESLDETTTQIEIVAEPGLLAGD